MYVHHTYLDIYLVSHRRPAGQIREVATASVPVTEKEREGSPNKAISEIVKHSVLDIRNNSPIYQELQRMVDSNAPHMVLSIPNPSGGQPTCVLIQNGSVTPPVSYSYILSLFHSCWDSSDISNKKTA